MSVDTIHTRTPNRDSVQSALVDVSDLPAERVLGYAREATTAGEEVHLEHRAGRTYLVTG